MESGDRCGRTEREKAGQGQRIRHRQQNKRERDTSEIKNGDKCRVSPDRRLT